MAIARPGTIDAAPARQAGAQAEDDAAVAFLSREECVAHAGEESRGRAVAAEAIEAKPLLGQIKPERDRIEPGTTAIEEDA